MNPRQMALAEQEAAAAERERQALERAAELRAKHKALLPDKEPFFRALFELGLLPGWRAILYVEKEYREIT